MPVAPFAPHHGFDPEMVEVLASVFEDICAQLGLSLREDRLVELVAQHVIAAAKTGVRNETALRHAVLQEFKSNPQ